MEPEREERSVSSYELHDDPSPKHLSAGAPPQQIMHQEYDDADDDDVSTMRPGENHGHEVVTTPQFRPDRRSVSAAVSAASPFVLPKHQRWIVNFCTFSFRAPSGQSGCCPSTCYAFAFPCLLLGQNETLLDAEPYCCDHWCCHQCFRMGKGGACLFCCASAASCCIPFPWPNPVFGLFNCLQRRKIMAKTNLDIPGLQEELKGCCWCCALPQQHFELLQYDFERTIDIKKRQKRKSPSRSHSVSKEAPTRSTSRSVKKVYDQLKQKMKQNGATDEATTQPVRDRDDHSDDSHDGEDEQSRTKHKKPKLTKKKSTSSSNNSQNNTHHHKSRGADDVSVSEEHHGRELRDEHSAHDDDDDEEDSEGKHTKDETVVAEIDHGGDDGNTTTTTTATTAQLTQQPNKALSTDPAASSAHLSEKSGDDAATSRRRKNNYRPRVQSATASYPNQVDDNKDKKSKVMCRACNTSSDGPCVVM